MKLLMLFLMVATLSACETRKERLLSSKHAKRVYMETSLGVVYFIDCVQGFKFIATHSGYGTNLAGPIGACDTETKDDETI